MEIWHQLPNDIQYEIAGYITYDYMKKEIPFLHEYKTILLDFVNQTGLCGKWIYTRFKPGPFYFNLPFNRMPELDIKPHVYYWLHKHFHYIHVKKRYYELQFSEFTGLLTVYNHHIREGWEDDYTKTGKLTIKKESSMSYKTRKYLEDAVHLRFDPYVDIIDSSKKIYSYNNI